MRVVPTSRREIVANPQGSATSVGPTGPVTTTTYKVTADPQVRTSGGSSRSRRSTVDSNNRPIVAASTPRTQHQPVIHTGTVGRPVSPLLRNPYRSSEEEYYAIPASSNHGHGHRHHRQKRYSATMDNADMHRVARERESGRLQIGAAREEGAYAGTTRTRPVYANNAVRHPDTVAADYGDNGYGYTNPRDLVQYDLSSPPTQRHHARSDSFDGGRPPRPSSITSYQDLAYPRVPYDIRESGPPLSTRGFEKIQTKGGTWEQPTTGRRPVSPPPSMQPIQRPTRAEPPFEGEPPRRRESVTRIHERPNSQRPVSRYHTEQRRDSQRDEYYESRDDGRRERPHRHDRYEDTVEQRVFGTRSERPERVDRVDLPEHSPDDQERREHREHKSSKEALASGLSIAGAALGVNALKKVRSNDDRDDREDREERRRRLHDDDYEDEPQRRRESRDDRETVDLSNRNPRERRPYDSELPPDPPGPSSGYDKEIKLEQPIVDLSGRDPKERHNSRDVRSKDDEARDEKPRDDRTRDDGHLRERSRKLREERERDSDSDSQEKDRARRHRSEATVAAAATAANAISMGGSSAIDSREDSSISDDAHSPSRHEPQLHSRQTSTAVQASEQAPAPFNPKDATDLRALKEALNRQDTSSPKESLPTARSPRASVSKSAREVANVRTDLKSANPRGRESSGVLNKENRQLRVVSPPREKLEEKPVKSILRAPRERFPEDPSPIREGVAPLKDAKKDGVPPDARWTKISRKLVNPAALEAGKERFEEREDFVIVLRVLSRDEVQGYAEVTERIRGKRFCDSVIQ